MGWAGLQGRKKVQKVLGVLAQRRPEAVVISFDAANAFNTISRAHIRQTLADKVPALSRVVGPWYRQSTTHTYWDESGQAHKVAAERGVDQGCPLIPAVFSISMAPKLEEIQ